MTITVKNGMITIEGNGNARKIFDYLEENFPGIRIEGTLVVGVFSMPLMIALKESPFYEGEYSDKEQSCI